MIVFSNQVKKYCFFILKIAVVFGAFYFIYNKLATNTALNWLQLWLAIKNCGILGVLFLILLSFVNRYLEICKWQNLVKSFAKISISEACKQVLGALTLGLFTPNGIGEYAGKALFYSKLQAKNIVFLNFVCNGIQMLLSILFGSIGLLYLGYYFWVILLLAVSSIVIGLFISIKNVTIKGYSLANLAQKINEIPSSIHRKNVALALFRYLVFSHQYYFLFLAFGVQLPYFVTMASIASVYFLASALPSVQFLDFAVKGSVALYFFQPLGINNWVVVLVTTIMWFLNVVIPVILGSYYVVTFKNNRTE